LRLFDDNNIRHIKHGSDRFLYNPKSTGTFISSKSNEEKKFSLQNNSNSPLFEEEPIEFNDLDSNMLNRNIIKFLPTASLRLELQIERAENRLIQIDNEIKACQILQMQEIASEDYLKKLRKKTIKEINLYKTEYRNLGFLYKVADVFSDIKTNIFDSYRNCKNQLKSVIFLLKILNKLPFFSKKQQLKELNILQKKLFSEINKKEINPDARRLEQLYFKTEKIGRVKNK